MAAPAAPSVTDRAYRPVEVVADAAPAGLGAVSRSVIAATLVASLLGSAPLLDWVNGLPVGSLSDALVGPAQAWQDWMAAAGLTVFGDAIRALLAMLETLRW
jgi:hypothetical protein